MPNITTRVGKGSQLTHTELDNNFTRTVTQKTTTYSTLTSDNRSVIEGNHATVPFTITLGAIASMITEDTGDYEVTITNINVALVSVDGNASETIDGSTGSVVLRQWESITVKADSAGTGWKIIARTFPPRQKAVKLVDESVTSATILQDDDDLQVTLEANGIYEFDSYLEFVSASATPDASWDWLESDGTWTMSVMLFPTEDGAITEFYFNEGTDASYNINLVANSIYPVQFKGLLRAGGAGGVFKLRWAQTNSDVTPTTLKAGSWMEVKKLN